MINGMAERMLNEIERRLVDLLTERLPDLVMQSFPLIVNDLMERLENELSDRMEVMESRILSRHMESMGERQGNINEGQNAKDDSENDVWVRFRVRVRPENENAEDDYQEAENDDAISVDENED